MKTQHKRLKIFWILQAVLFLALPTVSRAQKEDTKIYSAQQIQAGSKLYEQNCASCHEPRTAGSQRAFDLRKFPRDQRARFVTAVTKGKNGMPPCGALFAPEDIDNLWAYLMTGEKQ